MKKDFSTIYKVGLTLLYIMVAVVGSAGANDFITAPTTPLPEPSTLLLLGSGLIGVAGLARKGQKK